MIYTSYDHYSLLGGLRANKEGTCDASESVVSQNPPDLYLVDRQHKSREARSLYPSALQLAHALRLKFIRCAT
jgi:hypothetical protein